jgi:hypothetical protein
VSEHDIQAGAVAFLRASLPIIGSRLFAIPNGGARNIVTGRKLKAEGVRRGIPDLFYPVPVFPFAGLFIEVKTATGRVSPEQKIELSALEAAGYRVAVCRSSEEIVRAIIEYRQGE